MRIWACPPGAKSGSFIVSDYKTITGNKLLFQAPD
jgi:hypothetical protein